MFLGLLALSGGSNFFVFAGSRVELRGGIDIHRRKQLKDSIIRELLDNSRLSVLLELEASAGNSESKQPLSTESLLEIGKAKALLAEHIASRTEPFNGLAEPNDKCRTLLNDWMGKCVFG